MSIFAWVWIRKQVKTFSDTSNQLWKKLSTCLRCNKNLNFQDSYLPWFNKNITWFLKEALLLSQRKASHFKLAKRHASVTATPRLVKWCCPRCNDCVHIISPASVNIYQDALITSSHNDCQVIRRNKCSAPAGRKHKKFNFLNWRKISGISAGHLSSRKGEGLNMDSNNQS